MSRPIRPSRSLIIVVAYVAAYVHLDWVSYVYPTAPLGITPWNPPPGLSLFLLLRAGMRYWPALLIAAIAADVVVRGTPAGWQALGLSACVITAGYTAAVYVLRVRLRIRTQLDTARDLGSFVVVAASAALAVAALYVGLHVMLGVVPTDQFVSNLVRYWIGDLDGILVLAPALLVHLGNRGAGRAGLPECLLQGAAMLASIWAFEVLATRYGFVFFSVLFLPLTWIAVRHGMRGATLALAGLQLGLIGLIQVEPTVGTTFVQLQAAMLVLCVTGLALGAAVSHRLRVEGDLREKQASLNNALRFAAAGETTSALAHQLNQPIAALSNYLGACQLLMRSDVPGSTGRLDETLGKAAAEARRAGDIIHRIREFFRQGVTRPQALSALRIVEDAVAAARARTESEGIQVAVRCEGAADIHADPLQIETALQNVLNNAIDALIDGPRARRMIEIGIASLGDAVEIRVEDSGPGISAEIAAHMFEPFQSSRAGGMGLGLAIARTLLRANGGDIRADLSLSTGARFTLSVPVAARAAS